MYLGFSTTLLPELTDLPDIAARIAAAGYDGIEWRVHPDYHIRPSEILVQAPQLRELADAHGLRVPCLASYLQWTELGAIEQLLEAARILGCPKVRLAGFVYDRTESYERVHERALEQIARALPLLQSAGVAGLIETHFGTIHASAQGARQIVRHFDPAAVGVILDASNLCVEGREDWALSLDLLGPWLQHVHVRNTEWWRDDQNRWRWQWADLATGLVPWQEVFDLLGNRGYSGFATSENIWGVPKRTSGYIGEMGPYMGGRGEPRSIAQRLGDIDYLKKLARPQG